MTVRSNANGITTMLTLLIHPDTTAQRALRVVREDREGSKRFAIEQARLQFGPDAPLAWFNQSTRKTEPVKEDS